MMPAWEVCMKSWMLCLLGVGLIGATTVRAAGGKVAVVDMGQLIEAHPDTTAAEQVLEQQATALEAERKTLGDDFEKRKEAFQKTRDTIEDQTLSEKVRNEKMKEAESLYADLRQAERKLRDLTTSQQRQLVEERRRMQTQVVNKIREHIREAARKGGFDLVLDSANVGLQGVESVLHADDSIDITKDVLNRIKKAKP
ncbi:MAG: hypothetical protein A2498_02380 [Lentisphaerae bacterium RIFOXYC12_FULL_60_16]|nr:MAG: hypothetical protein A2498_02380 [Lentisphaerae bacterium RIFOXYC12_FULL_60_16]OGV76040.1 MAG: hypothetical protein A2340_10700 [Lentisphaerae bacterium RIFOXYB12_FULL_60_10]